MPLIPILDLEGRVQIGDLTRFVAEKTIKTKDITDPIDSVEIAPGTQPPIEVFESDPRKWFLDWVWDEWKWDIDSSMNKVYFTELGVEKTATIDEGEYTLDELLTEIEDKLEAAGAFDYTVSKTIFNEVKIEGSSKFKLLLRGKSAALLSILGFSLDTEEKVLHTGEIVDRARRKVVVSSGANAETASKIYYVQLFTRESDYLFSDDLDLIALEADVVRFVPKGRATHLNIHRKAQDEIIDWLDRQGYRDDNGDALTKWNVTDRNQVRNWSSYMALRMIFQGVHNSTDDVFREKAEYYEKLEIQARNRAILELALTKEDKEKGTTTKEASPSVASGSLYRR